MKKITKVFSGLFILVLLVGLSGCKSKDKQENDKQVAVYQAVLKTNIVENVEKKSYQLYLDDVVLQNKDNKDAVEFKDGVVLNVDDKIIDANKLKIGDKVGFILEVPSITTMSIPPQVAGNSVLEISLVE